VPPGCDLDLRIESEVLRTYRTVIGVDEVGRGALAGPMVVGAVAVSSTARAPLGIRDSKQLSASRRHQLVEPIKQWADRWGLGRATVDEIEAWGLRGALALALDRALDCLALDGAMVLMDGPLDLLTPPSGSVRPWPTIAHGAVARQSVVRGDSRCTTVAAASVLAKVARDAAMCDLAINSPEYGWERNKGYGTAEHLAALRAVGPCSYHRLSWLRPRQLSLGGASDYG
jgi:ribonuclease HII